VAERQRVAEATAAAAELPRSWGDDTRRGDPPSIAEPGVLVVNGALAARLAPQPAERIERAPRLDPAAAAASRRARIAHILLVAAAGVLLFVAGYTVAERDRLADLVTGVASRRGPAAKAGVAEVALHDAEQAFAARRYDDARRALARIPVGDPLRPAADVLRARIQRAWPIVSPMLAPPVPVGGASAPAGRAGAPGAGAP
jgi:hypothetical protein